MEHSKGSSPGAVEKKKKKKKNLRELFGKGRRVSREGRERRGVQLADFYLMKEKGTRIS